jgi:hypothetical protein
MKNELNNNDKVNNFLNCDLQFENLNEFDNYCYKNLREYYSVSVKDLGEEFVKAYECGYDSENYENPFKVNSVKYWVAVGCYKQGEQDC